MDPSALLHDVRRLMRGGVQQGHPAERHVVAAAALGEQPDGPEPWSTIGERRADR
jgi:hypothetical protein